MRIHRLALTLAIALGAGSPVVAQQHPDPPTAPGHDMAALHCGAGMSGMTQGMPSGQHAMPGMRAEGMMHGMMDMMGPPTPAMILHHKQQLGLHAAQVTRLEALQNEAQPACMRHMHLGMTAHQAANQLLDGAAPDFAAYAGNLKEATAHMVEGHVAMAKAAVAARDVLTAAQRQTLKSLLEQMHKKS